ncbi:MAG: dehydratase [Massilia sp.]|nr:dehydratase [Massilia sp.]
MSWYFEDFYPGQEIPVGSRTVSEEEIIAFATQYDPQPFHVDHDAAAVSNFKGVIASGWHTCGMMMRLMVDNLLSESSSMGSPGVDAIRWLLPVRPGDTISVVYQTVKVKASDSRPDRGVVWSKWVATNQHGQTVCTIEGMGMFGRRPAESSDA